MCTRCTFTDLQGRLFPMKLYPECSWCDHAFLVCEPLWGLIEAGHRSALCASCLLIVHSVRPGDFGRLSSHRSDQEMDVDANGWLSNAMRLLEDPVERPAPPWET